MHRFHRLSVSTFLLKKQFSEMSRRGAQKFNVRYDFLRKMIWQVSTQDVCCVAPVIGHRAWDVSSLKLFTLDAQHEVLDKGTAVWLLTEVTCCWPVHAELLVGFSLIPKR